ncbi:ComEC/Rec2 family competence protein [Lewinella sp. IMCC34183]|uniref:ComEC/Rec2 family competence protein n=1 Tax=Lewinella sp. IMCC34183 TaxID=2248762 RepID=UPI0018E5475A|nr:ComEC/Rec2 family competence protein [Lewinella sp. IMCC34183]
MTPLSDPERPPIPWAAAPLLLPVAALGAGVALAAALDYSFRAYFLITCLSALVVALALHLRPRPRLAFPAAAFLLLALFAFGGWYAGVRHPLNHANHVAHRYAPGDYVTGTVTAVRPGTYRPAVELNVTGLLRGDSTLPATGRLLTYLADGDSLLPGEQLLLAAAPETVPPPLNPDVFDYAAYLASQSIYQRAYADADEWTRLGTDRVTGPAALGDRARAAWFGSLTPYLSGDNLAVAAALIMGKRDLLGAEVRSAYADTGAIHVLAVSGLHVGILALIVLQLLGWLPSRWAAVRTALTVGVVWFFALVTGLSPSVQRAALMVTVVLIGKALNRNNGIFNLLAIAALVMLVAEPKQLFQVGFQLSFAAVAGIALFARAIQQWVYLPGPLRRGWDAISVSTAAQLGTLPFSLYYFGQFPVYFLLSGTLVIVFAYLVLGLGLLHGFLAGVGLSGGWLWPTGTLLNGVVEVQNAFIFFCRQLPGATLELSDFGLPSAVGLLFLVACLAYLAYRPSHRARWVALALLAGLGGYWILRPVLQPTVPQFTIYHLPRASLIDVYDGRRGMVIGDSVSSSQLDYQVMPLRQSLGVAFTPALPFAADTLTPAAAVAYPLMRLLDRRVIVLDGDRRYPAPVAWPAADLVLVRNGYRADRLPAPLANLPIVVDGSNPPYRTEEWRDSYPTAHLTGEDGAYRYLREE